MNNFAGIITFGSGTQTPDYLQRLSRKFPHRSAHWTRIEAPQMQAAGHFEASALNDELPEQSLFLDGEIFNREEIIRMIGASPKAAQNNATLLHTLILEQGVEGLAEVNGQYLIVYADSRNGVIHLITDHAGVQQVFYHQGADFFLFASEAKFLMAHPQCPCAIDWETGLRRPYPHTVLSAYRSYTTWFKDIHLLPEATACSIRYHEGKMSQSRFWRGLQEYAVPSLDDKRSAADVMEEYMALLDDAVKIRTQDTDRAYSLLSGGLDSSAICGLAAKHKPLESFSIINQTCMLEDTTSICDKLAKDLGFRNTQFLIPYHELVFNRHLWKQRIWRTESPVNHTDALTKNLLHYAIGKHGSHVHYVLTGTGSDQLNGGLVRWIINDEDTAEQSAGAFLAKVKEAEMRKLISRDDEGLWRMRKLVKRDYLQEMAGQKLEPNYWMYYVQSALHGQAYSLVWDEVRAAAAHNRSVRFPFLDYRFVPFIASVPERLHKELFYDKQILRTPSGKILPEYVTAKGKAPSFIPGYDFRFRLFDFFTSGADSLLEQAFGDRSMPHPVIDKEHLWKRVEAMRQKPEIYEWQELMDLINLGLLEQLGSKDERDLDFEQDLEVPQAISFENPQAAKSSLQERLGVKTEAALLAQPLQFAEGCALLRDYKSGAFFLAKNNVLAYEIDQEYAGWLTLLQAIDGAKSTGQILAENGVSFDTVREFFMLALKEQLLRLGDEMDATVIKTTLREEQLPASM